MLIIAPATANVIAKLACGIADDMLTTTALACNCPKIIAPAMNTNMYSNPITFDNIQKLKHYGYEEIPPESGMLAMVILAMADFRMNHFYLIIYLKQ